MLNNLSSIFTYVANGIIMVITPILFGLIILDARLIKSKKKLTVFIITMICLYILAYLCLEGIAKTIAGLVILVTIIIIIILKSKIGKLINIHLHSKSKILILFIINFIYIAYLFYNLVFNFSFNNKSIFLIIAMIFFLIELIIVVNQFFENNKLKLKYDKLNEIMKTYEIEIDNQYTSNHENKNQLTTIKSKIVDKEDVSSIIQYINDILDENNEISEEKYKRFQYLPPNGLKAMFYFKISEAESRGIHVTTNISPKIDKSIIYYLDSNTFKQLGRIIGVYLDNAIEASEDSKEKSMSIEIYKTKTEDIKFVISNSYSGTISEKIGKQTYSTKGRKRGHGLLLVNSIMKNTDIFLQKRIIKSNTYVQELIVKNDKKIIIKENFIV